MQCSLPFCFRPAVLAAAGALIHLTIAAPAQIPPVAELYVVGATTNQVYRFAVTPTSAALAETLTDPAHRSPWGITFSPAGEMFVSSRASHPVLFSEQPGYLRRYAAPYDLSHFNGDLGVGALITPHGIAFRGDELLIADSGNNRVARYRFGHSGEPMALPPITSGLAGTAIRGVLARPDGSEVFAAQCCFNFGTGAGNIRRYRAETNGTFTDLGQLPGTFNSPHGMAFSPWGELFAANSEFVLQNLTNWYITRHTFAPDGTPQFNGSFRHENLRHPIALSFSPWGELFVNNAFASNVTRFTFTAEREPVFNGSIPLPTEGGNLAFRVSGITRADPTPGYVAWTAASGLRPEQANTNWMLIDTASPEEPVLTSVLTLCNDQYGESMYYTMTNVAMPANLVIEFTARYVSGNSASSVRAPIVVAFTTQPNVGNALFIGPDTLFVEAGEQANGESTTRDTDNTFHDYRIEVSGVATGSPFQVYQDGVLILQGATFLNGNNFGPVPRLSWGEGSGSTYGKMEFRRFAHNAGVTQVGNPCLPSTEVFFGQDVSPHQVSPPGPNEVPRQVYTNSQRVAAQFLARISGPVTESFEGRAAGSSPTNLTFGANTATLAGSREVLTVLNPAGTFGGCFPTTGTNMLGLESPGGGATSFTVTFSSPQSAFGFYGTDIEQNSFTVVLTHQNGATSTIPAAVTVPQGSGGVFYFGVIDRECPFVSVQFRNLGGITEYFCFDDLTIATPTQVLLANILAGPITNAANGHFYYLLSPTNWSNAEVQAASLGGHLATLNDQAENDWVVSTFSMFGGVARHLWIGLTDRAQEGVFSWVDGDTSTYRNWEPDQPNNSAEHFAHIWSPAVRPGGKWNDSPDFGPYAGVVEVAPANTNSPPTSLLGRTVSFGHFVPNDTALFDGLYTVTALPGAADRREVSPFTNGAKAYGVNVEADRVIVDFFATVNFTAGQTFHGLIISNFVSAATPQISGGPYRSLSYDGSTLKVDWQSTTVDAGTVYTIVFTTNAVPTPCSGPNLAPVNAPFLGLTSQGQMGEVNFGGFRFFFDTDTGVITGWGGPGTASWVVNDAPRRRFTQADGSEITLFEFTRVTFGGSGVAITGSRPGAILATGDINIGASTLFVHAGKELAPAGGAPVAPGTNAPAPFGGGGGRSTGRFFLSGYSECDCDDYSIYWPFPGLLPTSGAGGGGFVSRGGSGTAANPVRMWGDWNGVFRPYLGRHSLAGGAGGQARTDFSVLRGGSAGGSGAGGFSDRFVAAGSPGGEGGGALLLATPGRIIVDRQSKILADAQNHDYWNRPIAGGGSGGYLALNAGGGIVNEGTLSVRGGTAGSSGDPQGWGNSGHGSGGLIILKSAAYVTNSGSLLVGGGGGGGGGGGSGADTPCTLGAVQAQAPSFVALLPHLPNPVRVGNQLSLNFPTAAGTTYAVQRSRDLRATNWVTITTVSGNGSLANVLVPATNAQSEFYRLCTY